jgi:IclR family transcriptional regulator, KDG regulon repressor
MDLKQSATVTPATLVPAVDRAIDLLQAIARAGRPLTLSELSELTATSRSTAYNTLATLQAHGLVEKNSRFKTYRLGLALFELGNAYIAQINLIPAFRECAHRMVEECAETVKLVVLDGRDVVYLATQEGPQSVRLVALVGTRLPAHVTAVGKVLLAQLTDSELTRRYANYHFPTRTQNSIDNFNSLQENLRFAREHGYAYDQEESSPGVNCVAAPIYDHTGEVIAAMSVGVPNHRLTANRMAELTQLLLRYANQLSRTLGWIEGRGNAVYSNSHDQVSASPLGRK